MPIYVLPYKTGSESAKLLAHELNVKRLRREKSVYKYKKGDVIINWGCTERPAHIPEDALVINPFECVATATNKLEAFKKLNYYCSIPHFTTDPELAFDWLEEGKTVVGRKVVNGYGGKGIILFEPGEGADLPVLPLYTKYIPKKSEYRVHVVNGVTISVARKTLTKDHPDKANIDWKIRNLDGGFVFAYWNEKENQFEKFCCPNDVRVQAETAIKALGLNFGAVDVIWQEKTRRAYVLEVNTAPGLGAEIAAQYADVLSNEHNKKEANKQDDVMLIFER